MAKNKGSKNCVIFLDIDGVLCTWRSHIAYGGDGGLMQHLDPVAVRLVAQLCRETNAQLVLSSTWRHHHDQLSMTGILQNAGFDTIPWHQIWKTPTAQKKLSLPSCRGDEIDAWLENAKPEVYVILDDFDNFHEHHKASLVLTPENNGLTWENYKAALRILLRQPKESK